MIVGRAFRSRTVEQGLPGMTEADYANLGRFAYSLINGAILMSFIGTFLGFGYAWYRLIRWAMCKAWPPKRS